MDSILVVTIAAVMTSCFSFSAYAGKEEQQLIAIAKRLQPIADSQWNEIIGSKVSDVYDISKGDTLWDISKRLFGNAFYWPKVWSLNGTIANPHIVAPGQKLAFTAGTSESTPKLATAAGSTPQDPSASGHKPDLENDIPEAVGKHEYEKISPDLWAPKEVVADKKQYDEYGIDRELKISIPSKFAFRVPSIANDTTITQLGEIIATRREGVGLSQHETVFLKSNSQDLQVGATYTVLSEPESIRERKSDRTGYVYRSAGEIKIIGIRDEQYIGLITVSYDVISRGMKVYPQLPLVSEVKPVAARTALEALVVVSNAASTHNSAQYHVIHLDRGIEDGVQIGNVFRVYDYYDPVTRAKITDSDFLINADAIVIHATAQFSTAIVLRSSNTFSRGDFAVLLTDVSDIEKITETRVRDFGAEDKRSPEDKELDELDELDRSSGEGLGKKEENEIKELDQWDKSKDLQDESADEATVPSAADAPTDDAEQLPGTELEPGAPQDPTLDQTSDAPSVTSPGLETPAPPAQLEPTPDQTLETPPNDEQAVPDQPSPEPDAEPITPPESEPGESE